MITDYFEHIDAYINGELTVGDRSAFEKEMGNNPLLQSAVDNQELAKEISLGFLEEEVRGVLNEQPPSKNTSYRWIGIGLALFLLSAIVYYYLSEKTTDPEPVQYAELYNKPAWPITRGSKTDLSDAITLGLSGDIEAAKKLILELDIENEEKSYWVAELYAHTAISDSTLIYLPKASTDIIRRDRINYLRILSMYNKGEKQEVKQLIDALPLDTDVYYMERYELILSH